MVAEGPRHTSSVWPKEGTGVVRLRETRNEDHCPREGPVESGGRPRGSRERRPSQGAKSPRSKYVSESTHRFLRTPREGCMVATPRPVSCP